MEIPCQNDKEWLAGLIGLFYPVIIHILDIDRRPVVKPSKSAGFELYSFNSSPVYIFCLSITNFTFFIISQVHFWSCWVAWISSEARFSRNLSRCLFYSLGDFEREAEWFPDAEEHGVSNMEFLPQDTPFEIKLKLAIVAIYNSRSLSFRIRMNNFGNRLEGRMERKQFILNYGFLNPPSSLSSNHLEASGQDASSSFVSLLSATGLEAEVAASVASLGFVIHFS